MAIVVARCSSGAHATSAEDATGKYEDLANANAICASNSSHIEPLSNESDQINPAPLEKQIADRVKPYRNDFLDRYCPTGN